MLATLICKIASDRSLRARWHTTDRLATVANRWLESPLHYESVQRGRVIAAYNVCSLLQDARTTHSREWLNRAQRWVDSAQMTLPAPFSPPPTPYNRAHNPAETPHNVRK